MTTPTIDKPTVRLTKAQERGKPLILEIGPYCVSVRRKGDRTAYQVPIESLYSLGAKLAAREAAREKGRRG